MENASQCGFRYLDKPPWRYTAPFWISLWVIQAYSQFFLSTILSNKFVFIPNFPSSNLLIYWEKKYVLSAEYFLDTDLGFGDPVVLKMFYHTGTWTHVPGFELDQNPAWDSNSHGWDSNPAKTHSNETRVPVVLSQWYVRSRFVQKHTPQTAWAITEGEWACEMWCG